MDAAILEAPELTLRATRHVAPAKVNLALHVTGRRPDGYHQLSSLVAFAAVGDALSVAPASTDMFETVGPFAAALEAGLAPGAPNIVVSALARLRALTRLHGRVLGPARIVLEKNLPVASGIGGGSADAAALLRLAIRAHPALAPGIRELAVELGADVPMCIDGAAARIAGIGEMIEAVPDFPNVPAVLLNPGVPVSTPLVFRALQRRDNPPMPELPPIGNVRDLVAFLAETRNDLEPPASGIAPAVTDAIDALRQAGALFARMSGSGATVFGLFDSAADAGRAAAAIRAGRPDWWSVATTLGRAECDA